MVSAAKRKSLEPDLLELGEGAQDDVLLGSKCKKCGKVFFPARELCVACCEPTCEPIKLSREGRLDACVLVESKPFFSILNPPYVIGDVMLPEGVSVISTINIQSEVSPEGVKIYSTITADNFDSVPADGRVRLTPVVIKRDEEGNDVIAFNYCIVKEA